MIISDIFITVIYQPFFNILVGFYWLIGQFTGGFPDMGIAVILLTLLIRLILLPISLSGRRSEAERREITDKIKEVEKEYSDDPIASEREKKKILRRSRKVLLGEVFTLIIQVSMALMLWRIFKTGLSGRDIHLIYPFMPEVEMPFNLIFLGKYDLSRTNLILNLTQSMLIFILETVTIYSSPYKVDKKEVVRMQLILPVVSFIIFMGLPAGKKLFVITTLIFSIILTSIIAFVRKFMSYKKVKEEEETIEEGKKDEEKLVTVKH